MKKLWFIYWINWIKIIQNESVFSNKICLQRINNANGQQKKSKSSFLFAAWSSVFLIRRFYQFLILFIYFIKSPPLQVLFHQTLFTFHHHNEIHRPLLVSIFVADNIFGKTRNLKMAKQDLSVRHLFSRRCSCDNLTITWKQKNVDLYVCRKRWLLAMFVHQQTNERASTAFLLGQMVTSKMKRSTCLVESRFSKQGLSVFNVSI